jgi:hypothetical protein
MLIYSNLTLQGFGNDWWLESLAQSEAKRVHEELWAMICDGTIKLPIACRHSLNDFIQALRADAVTSKVGKTLSV